jgi:DNA-directed RNA polymerase subunit K/omega
MRTKTDFELIQENGGKYALVMGVTKRAKQLNDGARPLAESRTLNTVATAITEVGQGRLKIIAPVLPKKEAPLKALPELPASKKNG